MDFNEIRESFGYSIKSLVMIFHEISKFKLEEVTTAPDLKYIVYDF